MTPRRRIPHARASSASRAPRPGLSCPQPPPLRGGESRRPASICRSDVTWHSSAASFSSGFLSTYCRIRPDAPFATPRPRVRLAFRPRGFLPVTALRSTDPASACADLFARFPATMAMSDSLAHAPAGVSLFTMSPLLLPALSPWGLREDFPCPGKELMCVPGFFDDAEPGRPSPSRFNHHDGPGAPDPGRFVAQQPRPRTPSPTLRAQPRGYTRMTRGIDRYGRIPPILIEDSRLPPFAGRPGAPRADLPRRKLFSLPPADPQRRPDRISPCSIFKFPCTINVHGNPAEKNRAEKFFRRLSRRTEPPPSARTFGEDAGSNDPDVAIRASPG